MHVIPESESTDVELTREVVDKYIAKWQDLKPSYKRVKREYRLVELDKLGEFRSSRWYNSFRFTDPKSSVKNFFGL